MDSTRRVRSYTRSYDSGELDAALLVLPLLGIDAADSDRVRTTIDTVACELDAGGPLIYRYPPGRDGLPGREGAFLPCAFWLVQALALTGRRDEAKERLAALVELANPLGLYAEELDPMSGEHLGNYPQALTHAALVQAALALRAPQRGDRCPRRRASAASHRVGEGMASYSVNKSAVAHARKLIDAASVRPRERLG